MRIHHSDVYVSFLEKSKNSLPRQMNEILQSIGREFYPGKLYEILHVTGEDEMGNDILPPFIQYRLS